MQGHFDYTLSDTLTVLPAGNVLSREFRLVIR